MNCSVLALAAVLLFGACQSKTEISSERKDAATKQGEEVSATLMKTLGTQLKAAMQQGGPENALQVCQQVAQPLTAGVSGQAAAATVSRTALRVRNPGNVADAADREVLEAWVSLLDAGEALPQNQVVESDQGLVFYKPIMTQAICLKCHGDPAGFSAELSKSLASLYPEDKALGFSEGELRGAFRVLITEPANES